MIGKIAVVTDSASYLPQPLIDRHGIFVVPLSVEIDGETYLEGVDITPDEFYARLPGSKSISTSQPSVGRFIEAYENACKEGAGQILSIHIGSGISGTVQSAQVASESSPIPVRIVDTGQASFAEGLCVWEAVDALMADEGVEAAAERALAASAAMGNTFVVRALDLVRKGGRLIDEGDGQAAEVSVLALTPEGIKVVGTAKTLEDAVDVMAGHVEAGVAAAAGRVMRVGVGHAAAPEIAAALRERLGGMPGVGEIVDYVVGPVIGAHTGAGSAGAVFVPRV